MHASIGTYARALACHTSPARAAGNYSNTTATLIAKGVIGILTLGIGYGIIRLVEHFGNVNPKIKEFTQNSAAIYEGLQKREGRDPVLVRLQCNKILTLSDGFINTTSGFRRCVHLSIDNSQHQEIVDMTLDNIMTHLRQDYEKHPDLYDDMHGPENTRASYYYQPDLTGLSAAAIERCIRVKNELFLIPVNYKFELQAALFVAYEKIANLINGNVEVFALAGQNTDVHSTVITDEADEFYNFVEDILAKSGLPGDSLPLRELRDTSFCEAVGAITEIGPESSLDSDSLNLGDSTDPSLSDTDYIVGSPADGEADATGGKVTIDVAHEINELP